MPRKTRRQYRKKNKRGGSALWNRITNFVRQGKHNVAATATKVKQGADDARQKVAGVVAGTQKKPRPAPEAAPPAASVSQPPVSQEKRPVSQEQKHVSQEQKPGSGTGGKRKSRRFRKKKVKVTLQGGRRRRSRKSKSRRRRR